MKKQNKKNLYLGLGFLVAFVAWTFLVRFIDVRSIGPNGSQVGLATVNCFVHNLTGVNMTLYTATDYLGLVPIGVAFGFAIWGLIQWIKRKSILKVDNTILMLGGFYVTVAAMYILFENVVINYRPVLIDGRLEISYPSSTTMLVLCVIPTATKQFNSHIRNILIKKSVCCLGVAFTIFMVIGRLASGVHWVTDIIGGALLSTGLVILHCCFFDLLFEKKKGNR